MNKILYLTPGCFDKGGISRYNRYQISALREIYGFNNVIVISMLGPTPGDFEDPFIVYWYGCGVTLICKFQFAFNVIKAVLKFKPKIIWVGLLNFSFFAILISKIMGMKSVLNVYGLELWSYMDIYAKIGLRSIDFVISDCHHSATYIEDKGFRKFGSTKVIWDCVDHTKFVQCKDLLELSEVCAKYGIPNINSKKMILCLGRVSKNAAHKGYERLLKVFSNLEPQNSNIILVIAGKGDLIPELKRLANELNIQKFVYFPGMILDNDLPKLYSSAYVFSLISDVGYKRGEGIPLTPLEAMACGSPVFVGNQDGSREMIFPDINGFAFDPFDYERQILTFKLVINDLDFRNMLSHNSIKISKKHFSESDFRRKHFEFIQSNKLI